MNIEAGKKYIDMAGVVTTTMRPLGDTGTNIFFSCFVDGKPRCYTSEGKYLTEGDHPFDLVAEYKEREIVDWVWGDDGEEYPVYANEDDAGADSLPLLDIFKPIRTQDTHRPAQFLARADDGSYLIQIGDNWDEVLRYRPEEVDDSLENVPEPEPTKARIYLCQNSVTGDKYIRSIKFVEDELLSICELSYSDEDGWQVRDLKGEKCNG